MLGVSPNSDNSVYSIPLEASPSTRQGFGRVDLGHSLPLPSTGSGVNQQVFYPPPPPRGHPQAQTPDFRVWRWRVQRHPSSGMAEAGGIELWPVTREGGAGMEPDL